MVAASFHALDVCIKRPDEEYQPVGSLTSLALVQWLIVYRGTYNSAIVYEAWFLIRLVQPKLILHLARSIDGVSHYIGRCQTLRFVPKHDQLVRVGIVFWVCRERFGLDLAKRIVASCLQCDWVNCIRLREESVDGNNLLSTYTHQRDLFQR